MRGGAMHSLRLSLQRNYAMVGIARFYHDLWLTLLQCVVQTDETEDGPTFSEDELPDYRHWSHRDWLLRTRMRTLGVRMCCA
jgi:hypothetical protein